MPIQNVIATYLGVALYAILYGGYTLWERYWLKHKPHFVPLLEADLDSNAVWGRGEGARVRAEDELAEQEQRAKDGIIRRVTRHIY